MALNDQPVAVRIIGGQAYAALFLEGIVSAPAFGGNPKSIAGSAGQNVFFQNAFTSDATNVYWAQSSGGNTAGLIARAPVGGGTPLVLATSLGFTSGIAVDASRVYWVDQDQGTLMSVPIAGGATATVASGLRTPGGLAISHGTLFFTDAAGDLLSAPASGGNATVLRSGPGAPPNTSVADWSPPVVTDDTNIYFSVCSLDGSSGSAGLFRVPISGGQAQLLAKSCATGIAVDAFDVYWVSGKQILAAPLTGFPPRTVAVSEQAVTAGPALDGSSVYWGITPQVARCGLCPAPPAGQVNAIMRAPK